MPDYVQNRNLHSARRYDLGAEPWIPVVTVDGRRATLSLRDVLLTAGTIDRVVGDTAVETAALLRFLFSTAAVILKPGDRAITNAAVDAFFTAHGERHWLMHPTTPFMQEPLLHVPRDSAGRLKAIPLTWLELAAPSQSSKAWWGKSGDSNAEASLAQLTRRLITAWFYSPGIGGRAAGTYQDDPDTTWRPRGTISFASHGLRSFWRGETLLQTILANVPTAHCAGLPLWLLDDGALPSASALTAATWTGSAYLLVGEDKPEQVVVCGRRIPDAPQDVAERKQLVKKLETQLWMADPTVMRTPVRKGGEDTGDFRPARAMGLAATSLQYAAEWWVTSEKRGPVRSLAPGLIEVTRSEVFSIRLDGQATAPELDHAVWVTQADVLSDSTLNRHLRALTSLVLLPLRTMFRTSAFIALGPDLADHLGSRAFDAFCESAEPLFESLSMAPALTVELAREFVNLAEPALMTVLSPYLTAGTVGPHGDRGGIAQARTHLVSSMRHTLKQLETFA